MLRGRQSQFLMALLCGFGIALGGLFVAFMIGANQPDAEAAQANAGVAVAAAVVAVVAGVVVAVGIYLWARRGRVWPSVPPPAPSVPLASQRKKDDPTLKRRRLPR